MFRIIRMSCRLVLLLILALGAAFLALFITPWLGFKARALIIRAYSKLMLVVSGIQIEIIAKKNDDYFVHNTLIVANHLSWLDILLIYQVSFTNFIGKVEMKKWPMLNIIIKAVGTVFINRARKRDLLHINPLISNELQAGRCICFFPEGRVGAGDKVLPFKSSLFAAAIAAKSQVMPIVLSYYTPSNGLSTEVSFTNCNLWQSVTRTLGARGIIARAVILETINAGDYANREDLALALHAQIDLVFKQYLH